MHSNLAPVTRLSGSTAFSSHSALVNRQTHVEQLESQITELATHITAATFRFLELVREFDEAEGWAGIGMRSCAHWLNWKCGINLGAAREKVRTAHALKDLPQISDSFRRGAVSYSKVRAMTRVATLENEGLLLNIAWHGTAQHVEQAVRAYRTVKRREALELDNARHALRSLNWHEDDDGSFMFRGRLDPEQGMLVIKALESCMDELFDEQKGVSAETPDAENAGQRQQRSPLRVRRADALVRMAERCRAAGKPDTGKAVVTGGDRALVHVHTNLETLKDDGTGATSELDGAADVSAETSRRLTCDAGVVHWLENQEGEPLSIGRKSRTVPPSIRRALQRRDRGCRFPGCTCERFVDAHHIVHWADGGETRLDNLVLLCRNHHRLAHENGFQVVTLNGQVEFRQPDGTTLPDSGAGRFRGNVIQIYRGNKESGIEISPRTAVSEWHGETMDLRLVMDGLIQRE